MMTMAVASTEIEDSLSRFGPRQQLAFVAEAKTWRSRGQFIDTLFPDEGPLRRELYPKHLEFFEAGLEFEERAAVCANRIGKTMGMGGYETTLHLTGRSLRE